MYIICGQRRMDPTVRQLWADMVTHTQELNTLLRANFYACSLELCTKTYEKGELRVHCHCFFYKENKKIHVTAHDIFRFQNSLPNVKAEVLGPQPWWHLLVEWCILCPGAEDRVRVPDRDRTTV